MKKRDNLSVEIFLRIAHDRCARDNCTLFLRSSKARAFGSSVTEVRHVATEPRAQPTRKRAYEKLAKHRVNSIADRTTICPRRVKNEPQLGSMALKFHVALVFVATARKIKLTDGRALVSPDLDFFRVLRKRHSPRVLSRCQTINFLA